MLIRVALILLLALDIVLSFSKGFYLSCAIYAVVLLLCALDTIGHYRRKRTRIATAEEFDIAHKQAKDKLRK
jgi:predicted membrane metal-binding protein